MITITLKMSFDPCKLNGSLYLANRFIERVIKLIKNNGIHGIEVDIKPESNIIEEIRKISIKGKRNITIAIIQKYVCGYYGIPISSLNLKTRKREIVQARQIAMYFSKNLTKSSLATIGSQIGDKDHATVLHACKVVNNLYDTEKRYKLQIDELEKSLKYYEKS